VVFVIVVGCWYINPANWTGISPGKRPTITVSEYLERHPEVARLVPAQKHRSFRDGKDLLEQHPEVREAVPPAEQEAIQKLKGDADKWGLISVLGLNRWLEPLDDRTRNPFMPFGLTGILVASAAVFFAYIGFDSISTQAEEAKKPQRDVPIAILASLALCTVLYLGVSAVITGMEPYPKIDEEAAVAVAFGRLAKAKGSLLLRIATGLVAAGAVAGMTSVLLVTLLSQARIFLAMARDGFLPPRVFGALHPRFRTPYLSTILTGGLLCVITAFTPINMLFNMVNIGTLLAFVIVCAAVLLLRVKRPEARQEAWDFARKRARELKENNPAEYARRYGSRDPDEIPPPFRCPALYLFAPLGIGVNLLMMLFLPLETWLRLLGWLALGLVIYFGYGFRHTTMARGLWRGTAGKPDLGDDAYYRSDEYRRRLRISVAFCAAVGLFGLVTSAALFILWRAGKLKEFAATLTFSDPATLVWLALGATAFVTFLFVTNLLEWQRARTAPKLSS
jgi:APA family basic amino acid/polyamine antiporter